MHQVYGAEKVKYGDKWYTWTANTSDKNPYLNSNESIIKAVVDEAKKEDSWTISGGTSKTSIKITVNGMEIEFQVTINGKVTVPVETDN